MNQPKRPVSGSSSQLPPFHRATGATASIVSSAAAEPAAAENGAAGNGTNHESAGAQAPTSSAPAAGASLKPRARATSRRKMAATPADEADAPKASATTRGASRRKKAAAGALHAPFALHSPKAVVAAAGPHGCKSSLVVNNMCSLYAGWRQQLLVPVFVHIASCTGSMARAKQAQHPAPKQQRETADGWPSDCFCVQPQQKCQTPPSRVPGPPAAERQWRHLRTGTTPPSRARGVQAAGRRLQPRRTSLGKRWLGAGLLLLRITMKRCNSVLHLKCSAGCCAFASGMNLAAARQGHLGPP